MTQSHPSAPCPGPLGPVSRRGFLAGGLAALVGQQVLTSQLLARAADPTAEPMSCILLWMNGGPSHLDTFDLKPGGSFKPIRTRAAGLEFSEHLPQLAEQADKLAVIRSMTTKEGNHDRGAYLMHTGYAPSVTLQHPSLGSWVSHELGNPESDLPSYVCIRGRTVGAGFLGVDHAPLSVVEPREGIRNLHRARDVTPDRFALRQQALSILQDDFYRRTEQRSVANLNHVYGRAERLMTTPQAAAFRIEDEPEAVQAAYGKSPFGQGCLLARRLIETGVRFVEVTLDGWDTHIDNFSQIRALSAELDPAYATLLRELDERDLLRRTLVIWMGEFGRTPRINPSEGRDHYPNAWSTVLAGSRVRPGIAYGATDQEGAKVVDAPMTVVDFFATLATLLGMDPNRELMSPAGRPIRISENGAPVAGVMR